MIGLNIETVDVMLESSSIFEYQQFDVRTTRPIGFTLFIDAIECDTCRKEEEEKVEELRKTKRFDK